MHASLLLIYINLCSPQGYNSLSNANLRCAVLLLLATVLLLLMAALLLNAHTNPWQVCHVICVLLTGEGVTLDEDDLFQCGRCKKQFSSLDLFMVHKRHQCSGESKSLTHV